ALLGERSDEIITGTASLPPISASVRSRRQRSRSVSLAATAAIRLGTAEEPISTSFSRAWEYCSGSADESTCTYCNGFTNLHLRAIVYRRRYNSSLLDCMESNMPMRGRCGRWH